MASEALQAPPASALVPEEIRKDFPGLNQSVHGKPLIYLDNAATTQRALPVIEAVRHMEQDLCANVHRGVHQLSADATEAFEGARHIVHRFINAPSERSIIFTRGTTESINLVAQTFGRAEVSAGDEVLITELEHHSNIVPWQMLCEEKGATLKYVPIDERGQLVMEQLSELLSAKTKIVAVNHISNALGTINPVVDIVSAAHSVGAKVLIDGAQATPHALVDVQALDADFYAFSGHKVFGPTGIGVLYGKEDLLDRMPPWQGGGDMITEVRLDRTTYNEIPYKFEAGTPNIEGAVGLGAALNYVTSVGLDRIAAYEAELLAYGTEQLSSIEGLRMIGTAENKASVLSFVVEGAHATDIGTILDHHGVAVRTGHHCAMPVMQKFGVAATARASLAMYNTKSEIDVFITALHRALEMLTG